MSIARRAPLACAIALAAAAGLALADEPPAEPASREGATAASRQTAAAETAATPVAAEPIPAAPVAPPVMPTTVVTPPRDPNGAAARPRAVSLGRHGEIELGRPSPAASRWRGFPISLSLRDAPLDEVLRSFARIAGINLVLSPGVTGLVTLELRDVPWDQALYVILKTHGMGAEIDGRVWLVEPY